jgi:hypothetical protein
MSYFEEIYACSKTVLNALNPPHTKQVLVLLK